MLAQGTRRKAASAAGLLSVALTLLTAARPVSAAPLPISTTERTAIQRVIGQQLEAFKRHDARGAFAYAAPAIQELFGSPERFMLMVSREYPPIYRVRSFTFGELEIVGGEFTQRVTVVGEDGDAAAAYYLMAKQDDGSWRILGCILVPIDETVI
jgi:hypothetical protein